MSQPISQDKEKMVMKSLSFRRQNNNLFHKLNFHKASFVKLTHLPIRNIFIACLIIDWISFEYCHV